ncbi:MAG: glycosyltransferase [Candidatus Levybacteria bacterium]|nr:glycosyltransferase [Candidatus Levybacteria bacterium]
MVKIPITIGIAAYNEGKNIEKLFHSIIGQKLSKVKISQVIVVSSGSDDKTNNIASLFSKKKLITDLILQKKRFGKAKAVNIILNKAKEDIIVLVSADVLLTPNVIEKLVLPLQNHKTGIVGSRPVPVNKINNFFGFYAHMLWNLHHLISLKNPKMGECIAFRKVFKQIPVLSSVDEVNIESIVKSQGYKAVYVPSAIVYNKGPDNFRDLITVRRRISAGHLAVKKEHGYTVSTFQGLKVIFFLLSNLFKLEGNKVWIVGVMVVEAYSRLLGWLDYKKGRKHTIWQMTESTKKLDR